MTNRKIQLDPDGDDNTETDPRLTLVPIMHSGDAGNRSAGTDIPSGAEDRPSPANPFSQPLCWLLSELCEFFCKYATFAKSAQPIALALWVIHTHLFEAARYTPYIYVHAPEKGSGKSRVLEIAKMVARHPFKMDCPSAAAIYAVSDGAYTLHIDEVDTIFGGRKNEVARAALNAGFQRGGTIPRFSQKKGEPIKQYNVFCPKLLAGIDGLPDTISDRSIEILMERRSTETRLPRFREDDVKTEVAPLNEALAGLHDSPELLELLKAAKPSVPDELSDRQKDISEPLLAIADLAGDGWDSLARGALLELFTAEKPDDGSFGVTLLADIQTVFEGKNRMTTENLLKKLIDMDTGSPWAEKWESKMRANLVSTCGNQLARYLKPYRIAPKQIRISPVKTFKGYEKAAFLAAWKIYCPVTSQTTGETVDTWNKASLPAAETPNSESRRAA